MECSCDRYIEIWNNVFMEFDRQQDGTLNPLPAPSVDTGMGLERITAVLQGKLSNYDTDAFTPLLAAIGERAGTTHHGTMSETDVSMRVVADHMRAMTFLIADGVVPSNEHRGYVLRKIMRRAMRHGKHLGMKEPFLYTLVDTLVREFGDAYPELRSGREAIIQVIRSEEDRFDAVLTGGLPRLEEALERAASSGGVLAGDVAFRLYDTHGLPMDFIEDTVQAARSDVRQGGLRTRHGRPAREGARRRARSRAAPGRTRRGRLATNFGRSSNVSATTSSAATTPPTLNTQVVGAVRQRPAGGRVARVRTGRFRRAVGDAVLPRSRRAGVGRGHDHGPAGRRASDRRRPRCGLAEAARGHGQERDAHARATW